MKKVLIVIGDVGGGHLSCARAIENAYKEYDGYEVKIVNLLELSKQNKFTESVPRLISKYRILEIVFNICYFLNNNCRFANYLVKRNFLNQNLDSSMEILEQEKPDILILNYAPLTPVIRKINERIPSKFKYIITVPDLGSISISLADISADLIFSPTDTVTQKLVNWGIKRDRIIEGYYPLRSIEKHQFDDRLNRKQMCEEFGFKLEKPIILITGCGLGTVNIIKRIKKLLANESYQFVIISGKDLKLKKELEGELSNYQNIKVIGWADQILKYMSGSDITIAKPGPATVLELQKLGKKAIFTAPVGLQEYGNVDYLLKNPNFRFVGYKYRNIKEIVENLLSAEAVPYDDGMKDAEEIVNQITSNK